MLQGVWLDADAGANTAQIDAGIALARGYPDVVSSVTCGSELSLRSGRAVAEPVVSDCLARMRAAGVTQPLTHQATWTEWCGTPPQAPFVCQRWDFLASRVDFISQTAYSVWENRVKTRFPCVPPEDAAKYHMNRQFDVAATYPDKVVIMSEVGYPGPPFFYRDDEGGAPCTTMDKATQLAVMGETLGYCRSSGASCILFASHNEPWKGEGGAGGEGVFGAFWG